MKVKITRAYRKKSTNQLFEKFFKKSKDFFQMNLTFLLHGAQKLVLVSYFFVTSIRRLRKTHKFFFEALSFH
jgi:hypothetical protein